LLGNRNNDNFWSQQIRTPIGFHEKNGHSEKDRAKSGAVGARNTSPDPQLQAIIATWPTLSESIKTEIVGLIRAAPAGPTKAGR